MITNNNIPLRHIDLDNIFVIPIGNNKNIVYLPLYHVSFYINDEGADAITRYKKGIPFEKNEIKIQEVLNAILFSTQNSPPPPPISDPLKSNNISIILHQKCNLECSYCFAHENRGNESLTPESVKQIIDWWIVRKGKKSVTFIGGGEPTLNWDLLYYAIQYIRHRDKNDDVTIKVITNGTLIDEKKIQVLEENRVKLSISFDILPDIQNSQRKYYRSNDNSYIIVDSLIRQLKYSNIEFDIRATITENSVSRMADMVRHVYSNYPHAKNIHLEHITDSLLSNNFYNDFTNYFFEARKIGKELGIKVYDSLTKAYKNIKYDGFCNGDKCFIPQPNGEIIYSFCHRFSNVDNNLVNNIKISTFLSSGEHQPNNDYKKFTVPNECNRCFARWHCAGGCLAERAVLSPELLDIKCQMVREFCKRLIIEEMNNITNN